MGKLKINFVFHNPNTEDETLKYITKVFTELGKNIFENKLNIYENSKKPF